MHLFSKMVDAADVPLHQHALTLLSPVTGRVLPIESAVDPLCRERLFGDGVVIEPSGFQLFSPLDAVVTARPVSGEIIKLRGKNGLQLAIQLGMNGQNLMGLGIKHRVTLGDKVKAGQLILEFDRIAMRQLVSDQVVFTLLNSDKVLAMQGHYFSVMAARDPAFTVYW
ncbi:MAG: PTS glucose transporter subunit IIA [Paraglaciecola sp.]|nr:PTS glucose transporter subunit IIA [Paraglaciecola sp.]NCT47090.1 PTS glucose transporter subunit IIA [Paraglaciecola sp.]